MFKSIFSYEDVIDCSDEFICFTGVTFLKDFGPWKKDESVEALNVTYEEGKFQEQDEDGNDTGKSCLFDLVARV